MLVVSYGNRAYVDTLKELLDFFDNRGFSCVAAIAAIAEHSIMHQFATGRPDESDQKELIEFAQKTNKELCISCMRCIDICPNKARKVNSLMVKVASKKMKAACAERKGNELFI